MIVCLCEGKVGKESQTGSFTSGTGTERLRHCDKRQSKCICKCKRLLSLLKHCATPFSRLGDLNYI